MKTITSKEYLPVPRFFHRELSTYHFLAPLARGWGGEGGRKWVLSPLLYANFPKQTWGGGGGSDHSHHYSTPAFQNKYEGKGGGGRWVLLSIISLHPLSKTNTVFQKMSEILKMDYKKKLSSFTRHQITKSLFSLHRSNYIVISGNQKDLSISYANK